MKHRDVWGWTFAVGVCLAGCDDPPEQQGPTGFMDGGVDAAVTSDGGGDASTEQPRTGPVFAVVSSDYAAASVSLLDAQGRVLADDYIHSGTVRAGLVTALSGDVDLPGHSGESGTLVLLDRLRTDVVTRIRLADGAILGQVKTHTPPEQSTTTSYSSNPQDYVYLDAQTAWVTRSEPNLDPAAPELDKGNDLFRLNPTTMQRANERIDLSSLNVTSTPPGAAPSVILFARPTRVARVGRTLVVGIARTAFDFKAVGDGVVALVDLDTKAVAPFALDGLKNCTGVDHVPNAADSVLVTCAGDFNATARDTAGIVLLGVRSGAATVEHVWRAKDAATANPLTASVVSLGGTLVVGASNDYAGTGADTLAVLDVASGQQTEFVSAAPGQGRFGTLSYDAESKLLLVPDGATDAAQKPTAGVRRFQRNADGSFTELAVTRVAASTAMPVRHVYPL